MASRKKAQDRRDLANNPAVHPEEREWKKQVIASGTFGTTTTTTTTTTSTTTTTTTT